MRRPKERPLKTCACGSVFSQPGKRCNSCKILDLFARQPSKACQCEISEIPDSPICTCGAFPGHRLRLTHVYCAKCSKSADVARVRLRVRKGAAQDLLDYFEMERMKWSRRERKP